MNTPLWWPEEALIADHVSYHVQSREWCLKGCDGCFTVTVAVSSAIGGSHRKAQLGPYQHCTIEEAHDLVLTLSSHVGAWLDARSAVERTLPLFDVDSTLIT